MQILKDEIMYGIIEAAEREFLKCGFSGMSMRQIASELNISASNIYNYFKNKDEIFAEIVKPAVTFIDSIIERAASKEYEEFDNPGYIEWHIQFINMIYKLIKTYRNQLILLFTRSAGSAYSGYKEKIARRYSEIQSCSSGKDGDAMVSDFFMYNFTVFYLNFLESLVSHELNDDELKRYLVEMTIYSHGGFMALSDENGTLFDKIVSAIGVE